LYLLILLGLIKPIYTVAITVAVT